MVFVMKIFTLLVCMLISGTSLAVEWKTESVDDGNIVVNSRVFSEKNSDGEKQQILEYNAEIITDASYEDVVNTLLDISKHKDFLDGAKESKSLEVNNGTTLVYYYLNAPWPMPDADCVTDMVYEKNDTLFEMNLTSNPDGTERTKVKRMSLYNANYTVEKTDDGSKIKIDYRLSPVSAAPAFLVKTWFPDGPADIIKRIANLSK